MDEFLERLAGLVGPDHVISDAGDMQAYLVEPRGLFHGSALAVARPGSAAEVAAVLALANAAGIAIVPQGGNTGLVGGQVPDASGRQLILSLNRLTAIREVDPLSDTITVEAGVTLARVQEAAETVDRLFPLSLASEGSCTVGGNLSSNAGGTAVLAYGNARDLVLGLEVALPDGRLWHGLGKLRKDNTGYDLKHLFIGAEGTLGIITAAVLKLFPRPRSVATAYCGLTSPEAALAFLALAKRHAGPALTTFELMPRIGLEFVARHARGARDPLAGPHPWYVLIELSSPLAMDIDVTMEGLLADAFDAALVDDAALARSSADREDFWHLREAMSEVQGREGGSIKHDISVPVALVPQVVAQGCAAVEAYMPAIRPVPFGHLGDGNLHFNFSQPVDMPKAEFLGHWDKVNAILHAVVLRHGGSISAEHGIGQLKRHLLAQTKSPVALDLMRAIKGVIDPNGILNPGKVL